MPAAIVEFAKVASNNGSAGDGLLAPVQDDVEPDFRAAPRPAAKPVLPLLSSPAIPWIFAAKTTASALLALAIAFAFNLDQPKWVLLTVFIVAQPQSGLVLAKSFYRILGTLTGAAVALLLVSLFAQERVLFLGALAIWLGLCTYASKLARNFTAYGFVLSGYTVAIVGIPGALEPGQAFYIAQARITEISLGIMTTAVISHLVLPMSLAQSLRRAVAASRAELADAAVALLDGRDVTASWTKLLGQVMALENQRASAVFEDRDIGSRSDAIRRLGIATLRVIDVAQLLGRSADWRQPCPAVPVPGLNRALAAAAAAILLWREGKVGTADLQRRFARASADLPLVRELCRESFALDEDVVRSAATIGYLRSFLGAFTAFAKAHDAFASPTISPPQSVDFAISNDRVSAAWAGVRAGTALLLASTFWILVNWPSGYVAAILAAVFTARLATMEHATESATKAALLFALITVPFFIVIEVLLAQASGFAMFALVVAPVLFGCAWLMANSKTAGLGLLTAVYFASVAEFQDQMAYDPVGFINVSLAVALAAALVAVLFAVIAPDTSEAARRRFVKALQKTFEGIVRPPYLSPTAFGTTMVEAQGQMGRALRPDRAADVAMADAGLGLLRAGRELIRIRDTGRSTYASAGLIGEIVDFLRSKRRMPLDRALHAARDASTRCLADVRDEGLGVAEARAAARDMFAFAAIGDELERCRELLFNLKAKGVPIHAA